MVSMEGTPDNGKESVSRGVNKHKYSWSTESSDVIGVSIFALEK